MLSEFVRLQMLADNLTVDQICRRAGNRISPTYLRKIINDTVGTISVEIAEALSIGLGVTLSEVVDAALRRTARQTPTHVLERLSAVYNSLNADQQTSIEPLLEIVRREMLRLLDETQQTPPSLPRELS